MSRVSDSRKDSHSTKLEQRPQIFVILGFGEFCDSRLCGFHPFGNMVIIHQVKNMSKAER